jgi:metal-responsive CopG/Arc/MetJ family transcriptional regulator
MPALSLRLPESLEARLDREALLTSLPRSEIIRTAIEELLARRDRERVVGAYVREARTIYGNSAGRAEALTLAEEALPLDNEAEELAAPASARVLRRRRRS